MFSITLLPFLFDYLAIAKIQRSIATSLFRQVQRFCLVFISPSIPSDIEQEDSVRTVLRWIACHGESMENGVVTTLLSPDSTSYHNPFVHVNPYGRLVLDMNEWIIIE